MSFSSVRDLFHLVRSCQGKLIAVNENSSRVSDVEVSDVVEVSMLIERKV